MCSCARWEYRRTIAEVLWPRNFHDFALAGAAHSQVGARRMPKIVEPEVGQPCGVPDLQREGQAPPRGRRSRRRARGADPRRGA